MKTIEDAASVYNVPPEFGSNTCMMALYITELLTFSYGFPVNTNRIYSFKDINGKSLGKIKRTFFIMKKIWFITQICTFVDHSILLLQFVN